MKVRKRPVVVDAWRWWRHGDHLLVKPLDADGVCGECGGRLRLHGRIDTREGSQRVCPGDWIIRGVMGEHYPCKHDVFVETYELEEDE